MIGVNTPLGSIDHKTSSLGLAPFVVFDPYAPLHAEFNYDLFLATIPRAMLDKALMNPDTFNASVVLKQLLMNRVLRGAAIDETLYKTLDFYNDKYMELRAEGMGDQEATDEAMNGGKLLRARLLMALTYDAKLNFIEQFSDDELLVWLPSSSKYPRDEHMLHYGQTFTKREMLELGWLEDYGCKCGAVLASEYHAN